MQQTLTGLTAESQLPPITIMGISTTLNIHCNYIHSNSFAILGGHYVCVFSPLSLYSISPKLIFLVLATTSSMTSLQYSYVGREGVTRPLTENDTVKDSWLSAGVITESHFELGNSSTFHYYCSTHQHIYRGTTQEISLHFSGWQLNTEGRPG